MSTVNRLDNDGSNNHGQRDVVIFLSVECPTSPGNQGAKSDPPGTPLACLVIICYAQIVWCLEETLGVQ